jgi:hypothetical protein
LLALIHNPFNGRLIHLEQKRPQPYTNKHNYKMMRKISRSSLLFLLSATLLCDVTALQPKQPIRGDRFPNGSIDLARGGVLQKKNKSLFGVFDKPAVVDEETRTKSTTIHTSSSIVQGSTDVDTQYRKALIKTALTVSAAGTRN